MYRSTPTLCSLLRLRKSVTRRRAVRRPRIVVRDDLLFHIGVVVDVRRHFSGTTDKKEAQELHDKLKHEAWRVARMGERPRRVFEEAAARYPRERAGTTDYDDRVAHIRYFRGFFAGRDISTLTRAEIMEAIPMHSPHKARKHPLSPATRKQYLATIRSLLKTAADQWEWIERAPRLPQFQKAAGRIRWITREEAKRLLHALDEDCMRDITAFDFATGLRQRNALRLEWSQVDLDARRAWIHPDQAKACKPIGIPLSDEAIAILRRLRGMHPRYVFVRDAAGVERTGGWPTHEMVLRYAHLAPDHLASHAGAVLLHERPPLAAVQ